MSNAEDGEANRLQHLGWVAEKCFSLPDQVDVAQLFDRLTTEQKVRVLLESQEVDTGVARQTRAMLSASLEAKCQGNTVVVSLAPLPEKAAAAWEQADCAFGIQKLTDRLGKYLVPAPAGPGEATPEVENRTTDPAGATSGYLPDPHSAAQFSFPSAPIGLDEDTRLRYPNPLQVLRVMVGTADPVDRQAPVPCVYGGFAFDFIDTYETGLQTCPPPPSGEDFPDYWFFLARSELLIDHATGLVRLRYHYFDQAHQAQAEGALADLYSRIRTLLPETGDKTPLGAKQAGSDLSSLSSPSDLGEASLEPDQVPPKPTQRPQGTAQSAPKGTLEVCPTVTRETYAAQVEKCQEYIHAGDIYQVVPARGFRTTCPDPFAAYCVLRGTNPSPYLFYLKIGQLQILGSSPESALRVEAETARVAMRPIAGTQPRALKADGTLDQEEDLRAQVRLRTDTKETAEHMMLVDLARNDLARICAAGTRQVSQLLILEKYSRVMHLVSEVAGRLRTDLDALDAYRACMNMGTLTGAPKLRAMEILRECEQVRRGVYGGAVGYFSGSGDFDTAIAIRCAQVVAGKAIVRAGAGVVRDSQPAAEAAETFHKARAVLEAIAQAQNLRIKQEV